MKISILPHMVKQVTARELECSKLGHKQLIQVFCSIENSEQPSEEATVKNWSEGQVPELEGGHTGKSQVKGAVMTEVAGTGQNTRSGAELAFSRILEKGNEG